MHAIIRVFATSCSCFAKVQAMVESSSFLKVTHVIIHAFETPCVFNITITIIALIRANIRVLFNMEHFL